MRSKLNNIFWAIGYCEKTERGMISLAVIAKIANAIMPFALLLVSKLLIESVQAGVVSGGLFRQILVYLAIYLLLSLIYYYGQEKARFHLKNFQRKHTVKKADHLLSIDYKWTEDSQTQDLLAELFSFEPRNVFNFASFTRYVSQAAGAIVAIGLAIYFVKDAYLTGSDLGNLSEAWLDLGFSLGFVLSFGLTLRAVTIVSRDFGKAIGEKMGGYMAYIRTCNFLFYRYQTGKDIRLYSEDLGNEYSERYQEYQEAIHTIIAKVLTKGSTIRVLIECMTFGLIVAFVGLKAAYQAIPISLVLLLIGAFTQMIHQGVEFADTLGALNASDSYRVKLREYYSVGSTDRELTDGEEFSLGDDFKFEVKSLSFAYPGTERKVIKDLSFELKAGQRLAIVGMNGSGKTSLIKVFTGLYSEYEGQILLNGQDIGLLDRQAYSQIFAPVFQDFKLLALSVRDNLTSFRDVADSEISEVMDRVGMGEFRRKHGLDAYVTKAFNQDGIEVSGGEAQKLALARAILKQGQIFILDEPTSALDPIAESEIYSKFNQITSDKTTIFISHRLSSCKFCDSILVMDHGRLVQAGNHTQLLADKQGKYAELWQAQAQHYQD